MLGNLFVSRLVIDSFIVLTTKITVVENEIITLNKGLTGRVSVFAMGQKAKGVYLKGLSYEMENGTITEDFPIGVSNEFVPDKEAEIGVADGTLLVYIERL